MSIVYMIIFLGQARSWPKLMIEWSKTERQMKHFHPILGLSKKIYFFIFMFGLGTEDAVWYGEASVNLSKQYNNRIKQGRVWLLLGWVTADQSCPYNQPPRP
ncbi:hypothetical protein J6590_099818 [Homalodisca vitripennis]|nr:hypothetical protein J6590_084585 [Homalodisca vitripennis]KAG8294595.1 hypothetical protein J6590_099818 [Homalodisca vitripennis]